MTDKEFHTHPNDRNAAEEDTNDGIAASSSGRYSRESRLIHGPMRSRHWSYSHHIVPPVGSSVSYRLESADRGAAGFQQFANPEFRRAATPPIGIYDRLEEPTRSMLEEHLAIAEGGESCVTFATGMAAISAALGVLLRRGDRIIAHRNTYGCTVSLLANWFPRLGIEVTFADLTDLDVLEELLEVHGDTMVVYGETPTNPNLELLDLRGMADRVEAANAERGNRKRVMTVIDNTFATPFCQRPLEHGIDLVVHSLTKNIGGFGTDMGGAVIGPALLEPDLLLYRKDFGAALSPKAAWPPLTHGLPTLAVRMRRQQETALQVATFLEDHVAVQSVAYPGLASFPQHHLAQRQMVDDTGTFAPGSMIAFRLAGDDHAACSRGARFMDALARDALTVTLAVSLGQIRTLIEHPASMTHSTVPVAQQPSYGIDPGGIRLSLGLEPADDILRDLESGLENVD